MRVLFFYQTSTAKGKGESDKQSSRTEPEQNERRRDVSEPTTMCSTAKAKLYNV